MSSFKDQLIRLGSTNPELRPHILPVLDALGVKTAKSTVELSDKAHAILNDSYKKLHSEIEKLAKEGEKALNKYGFKVTRVTSNLGRDRKPYISYEFSSPDPESKRAIKALMSEILGDSYWTVDGDGMKWDAYWEME